MLAPAEANSTGPDTDWDPATAGFAAGEEAHDEGLNCADAADTYSRSSSWGSSSPWSVIRIHRRRRPGGRGELDPARTGRFEQTESLRADARDTRVGLRVDVGDEPRSVGQELE